MNPIERSPHPTREQVEAIIQFMERNPSLARGFPRVLSAREAACRSWERLAVELNSMGGSAKSWKQWTKCWSDKKKAVRKKAALRCCLRRSTSAGVEEVTELSEVEERIIALMGGGRLAVGDMHSTIDPFNEIKNSGQFAPAMISDHPRPPLQRARIAMRSPSQLPMRNTTPRRRRRSSSSQVSSSSDRLFRLQEQWSRKMIEVAAKRTDALAAIAIELESIGDGIQLLAKSSNKTS